jgi:protein-arginine kinase activator protein McsA
MEKYRLILVEIEESLQKVLKEKALNISSQNYLGAAMKRDEKQQLLDKAKDLLIKMKLDIEELPTESPLKLELMILYQNYMEDFGFDHTKKIQVLKERNREIFNEIEALKNEKNKFLANHNFTEANRLREKIAELKEEREKNWNDIMDYWND